GAGHHRTRNRTHAFLCPGILHRRGPAAGGDRCVHRHAASTRIVLTWIFLSSCKPLGLPSPAARGVRAGTSWLIRTPPMHHDGQPLVLRAYGVTDKGPVRSTNEDHFVISERLRLLVVADGMGGHKAGEVASHVAVDAIVKFVADRGDAIRNGWPSGFDQ